MPQVHRRWGWKRDLPDFRDKFFYARPELMDLPAKVDLGVQFPPIVDQMSLGSCVANAVGNAYFFAQRQQKIARAALPSRLFIYYNGRSREGTIHADSGMAIRDGIKTVVREGICPESMWSYQPEKFAQRPPVACYTEGKKNQAVIYQRVPQIIGQLKAALVSGFPIVFGFSVFEGFESDAVARTGVANLPKTSERMLGGHAVAAVGYDDETMRFKVANSWGTGWGQSGYFTMPFAYLLDTSLSSDFWVIKLVEV